MKKTAPRKLKIRRETLRNLAADNLRTVVGGAFQLGDINTVTCKPECAENDPLFSLGCPATAILCPTAFGCKR